MRKPLAFLAALVHALAFPLVMPAHAESLINYSTAGGSAAAVCSDAVPAPAAAAGYNAETLCTNNFSPTNTDNLHSLNPGYTWYPINCFGFGLFTEPLAFSGGAIVIGSGAGGTILTTATCPSSNPPYWQGTAYGGGFYWEATMSFASTSVLNNPYPTMWTMAVEGFSHTGNGNPASQWPGQVAGYAHVEEVDVLEYKGNGAGNTDRCSHDWYGTASGGFNGWAHEVNDCDFPTLSSFGSHVFGLLWVPATGSTNGQLVWYYDGSVVKTITYAQFITTNCQSSSTQCPPPVAPGSSPGIIDSEHMALMFNGGVNNNTVSNVHVFQTSAANNISQ